MTSNIKNTLFYIVHQLKADNGVQLRNEAADVRLIEQILDPLLESMLGIRFRKKKKTGTTPHLPSSRA